MAARRGRTEHERGRGEEVRDKTFFDVEVSEASVDPDVQIVSLSFV